MTKNKFSLMCLIALVTSFSIFMTSCSSSKTGSSPNQMQNSVSQNTQSSNSDSLDKDNQGKLVCLFFPTDNTNSLNKTITIEFSKDLSSYKFKKVKLLQNDKTVSDEIKIIDGNVIWNKVTIGLNEFIPEFNKAEFTLASGKTMTLNIGQYYLEQLDYKKNVLKDNQIYHLNNCTTHEKGNRSLSEYELSIGDPSKLYSKISKKILGLGYTQKLVEKNKNNSIVSYEYSGEIPLDSFKQNNITTVSYEAIFQQETLDKGITNFVFQDFYTLEAK